MGLLSSIFGGDDQPDTPNYSKLAKQQAELQRAQWEKELNASRPTTTGPLGTVGWTVDPKTGEWTQTTTLDPTQQKIWDQQQAYRQALADKMLGAAQGTDFSPLDFSNVPGMPTVGGYNQQIIDTIRQLQSPELAQRREAQDARLAAMGLGTGSGMAWENAQRSLTDAENRADLDAILAGYEQGNTAFGQGMQAHQQGIQDIINQRAAQQTNLQGLAGLVGGTPLPQGAEFGMPSSAGVVPNITGAAGQQYAADMGKYNANQQASSNLWGGLAGLAGTVGGWGLPGGGTVGGKVLGSIFG